MSKTSSPIKSLLPPLLHDLSLLLLLICQELVGLLIDWFMRNRSSSTAVTSKFPSSSSSSSSNKATKSTKKFEFIARVEELEPVAAAAAANILDLPELALECILGKLSPEGLLNMACVCRCLRDRCRRDRIWGMHLSKKWGPLLGREARCLWESFAAAADDSRKKEALVGSGSSDGWWMGSLFCVWPFSSFKSSCCMPSNNNKSSPLHSTMDWYMALESGRFWFPAQVYNRENEHVGFVLSCYDAELCYDRRSDTFYARYHPHGCRTVEVEEGVPWNRIRVAPLNASPLDLHASDCLSQLSPGDHVEIQWRRKKEFPFGWWYGVIGHLESCDGNVYHCLCHRSDRVIVEFKQYSPGSRWRRASVCRKNHREEGNETDGFYGGIRKLHCSHEISMWRQHWPAKALE